MKESLAAYERSLSMLMGVLLFQEEWTLTDADWGIASNDWLLEPKDQGESLGDVPSLLIGWLLLSGFLQFGTFCFAPDGRIFVIVLKG